MLGFDDRRGKGATTNQYQRSTWSVGLQPSQTNSHPWHSVSTPAH